MVEETRRLTIREVSEGEEFSAWLDDLNDRYEEGERDDTTLERHLVLTDEIGDWIGGLRYTLRGGVAQVVDVGVVPHERHQGHAHRLLAAFEQRAAEQGAHLFECWTDHLVEEGFLEASGWAPILRREEYIGSRTWWLLEKRLPA